MRNSEAIGFTVGDRADGFQALGSQRLGIAEADDQEFSCGDCSGGRVDQNGFTEFTPKQGGLADMIEQAV